MKIPGIVRSGKNVGWKMVYNFLGKEDEKKNGEISSYFRLKHPCGKEF